LQSVKVLFVARKPKKNGFCRSSSRKTFRFVSSDVHFLSALLLVCEKRQFFGMLSRRMLFSFSALRPLVLLPSADVARRVVV